MKNNYGIDSLSFYIPRRRISVHDIIEGRSKDLELSNVLRNAEKTTKQTFIRLTYNWQDSVAIAAQSFISLIQDNNIDPSLLRYVIACTETPVDVSKPNSSYFLSILPQVGIKLPSNMVNYQVQHACAAGTIGLIQAISLLQSQGRARQSAIVSMSDISHYEVPSSAEITQGAGSVALHISENPRLLEVDIVNVGYYSSDVDDFFRPIYSPVAKVKGRYSMQCYIDATFNSLIDYGSQISKGVEEIIEENDYLVFHTPFASMPETAVNSIIRKKLNKSKADFEKIMEEKRIESTCEVVKQMGNSYTAATYFPLGNLLSEEYKRIGDKIIGKKILLLSYGAGNTSVVLQTRVSERASEIISSWNLQKELDRYHDISFEDYSRWCASKVESITDKEINSLMSLPTVYISEIRAHDTYRLYGVKS